MRTHQGFHGIKSVLLKRTVYDQFSGEDGEALTLHLMDEEGRASSITIHGRPEITNEYPTLGEKKSG